MTQSITPATLQKPIGNKQPQDSNGNEFDDDEEEDDDNAQETRVDLIQLVRDGNRESAELFFQFSQAKEDDQKQEIFDKIKTGLTLHTQLVEELYYPLLPETAKEEDKEDAEKLVFEAEASNYVAAMILEVLATMKPSDDYFDGKVTVLHTIAKEQAKREEKEIFEKLKTAETEIDFEEIGLSAAERKMELQEEMASIGKRSKKSAVKGSAKKAKPGTAKGKSSAKSSKTGGKAATAKKSPAKAKTKASSAAKSKAKASSAAKSKAKPGAKAKAAASKSAKKPAAKKSAAKRTR